MTRYNSETGKLEGPVSHDAEAKVKAEAEEAKAKAKAPEADK